MTEGILPYRDEEQLRVEWELTSITRLHADQSGAGENCGGSFPYPAFLGRLAVDGLLIHPDTDAENIALSVKRDFVKSYDAKDVRAGASVRERSMAWLDWLTQQDKLHAPSSTYVHLAAIAARQGDAEVTREVVGNQRRLWPEVYAAMDANDPAFGRLDLLSTPVLSTKALQLAELMKVTREHTAAKVQGIALPVVDSIVTELASRNLLPHASDVLKTV